VITTWLIVLVALTALTALAGGTYRDDAVAPGTSSERATNVLLASFPEAAGAQAHVVAQWPALNGGLRSVTGQAAIDEAVKQIASVPGVREAVPRVSEDGRTVMVQASFNDEAPDLDAAAITRRLDTAAAPLERAGARTATGGEVPESGQGPSGMAEAIGAGAALVILLLAFGSVLAAGLPLAVAAVGLGAGMGLIGLLAAMTDVSSVAPTLGAMLGLGVGIDYALLMVARYRDCLGAGLAPVAAAATTNSTAGRSVVFAGTSVLIGILGLALSAIPMFTTMGMAAALVIAVTVATSITLVPTLLALAGPRVFSRKVRRSGKFPTASFSSPHAAKLARRVVRRPVSWLLASLLILMVLAAPALGMRLGNSDAGSEAASDPTRQAYDMVAEGFGPGANGPLAVVVDNSSVSSTRRAELATSLAQTPGVAEVTQTLTSAGGEVSVLRVFPTTGPQAEATQDLVRRLHATLPTGVDITGPTAATLDLTDVLSDRFPVVIAAVLLATFALLVVVFRSLVVPLKAVVTNLLSVVASYGVLTLAFQTSIGADLLGLPGPVPIPAWAPVVLFAILFGLSMDYEVFMLSRVRHEFDRTGDARGSVIVGLADTARIITSAATIMIAVALGFAFDPGVMVKIIGVGMASAIAIDVTVSRMLLVPAAMALLGRANWYLPKWLDRLLPDGRHGAAVQPRLRRATSASATAAATEAFSDSAAAAIGIDTRMSHVCDTRRDRPRPSDPTTIMTG
jgi:RND superfamily putative drug exporter